MRIVVSGSSGFIGTALVEALATAGHEPVRLVRDPAAASANAIAWDPDRGVLDPASFEGVDAVVNLNGVNLAHARWTPEFKREMLETRTKPTQLLATTLAG